MVKELQGAVFGFGRLENQKRYVAIEKLQQDREDPGRLA
jgi:hypothetical protein